MDHDKAAYYFEMAVKEEGPTVQSEFTLEACEFLAQYHLVCFFGLTGIMHSFCFS